MHSHSISTQEAAAALDQIHATHRRVREFREARHVSPFLILWGLLWFGANATAQFAPVFTLRAWITAMAIGCVATIVLVTVQVRQRRAAAIESVAEHAVVARRAAILGSAVTLFLIASIVLLQPLGGRQINAWLSLFWGFAYIGSSAWLGNRMLVTGIVTVLAVLAGYFLLGSWYPLWMATIGGGSLLLGGLWLRNP